MGASEEGGGGRGGAVGTAAPAADAQSKRPYKTSQTRKISGKRREKNGKSPGKKKGKSPKKKITSKTCKDAQALAAAVACLASHHIMDRLENK